MKLREVVVDGPRKPERVIEVPVSLWADTAEGKPPAPVSIGLRLPSEKNERDAGTEGAEREYEVHGGTEDERVRAYNSGVMVLIVTAAACLTLDASQPFFDGYLDTERRLTKDGLRFIYDQIETLQIAAKVAVPEIGDEGFSHLIAMWERGEALGLIPELEAQKLRRVLEYVRQQMANAEEEAEARGMGLAV